MWHLILRYVSFIVSIFSFRYFTRRHFFDIIVLVNANKIHKKLYLMIVSLSKPSKIDISQICDKWPDALINLANI